MTCLRASADQSSVLSPAAASTTATTTSRVELAAERLVGGKGLQDRARIGEAAGFDHDAGELREFSALALGDEAAHCDLQIGARGAADAAIAEQHRLVRARAHQDVVDADRAELVDDHRRAGPFRRGKKVPQQRGLAGAEKAGDHGHRDACPALAPQPATEFAGRGRREQLLH